MADYSEYRRHLNGKIEILIEENNKLNNIIYESQNQIEYWKSRFFSMENK